MDKMLIDLQARLNLHEALLEVIEANLLASTADPKSVSENVKKNFLQLLKFDTTVSGDLDAESAFELQSRTVAYAERYFARLETRLAHLLKSAT